MPVATRPYSWMQHNILLACKSAQCQLSQTHVVVADNGEVQAHDREDGSCDVLARCVDGEGTNVGAVSEGAIATAREDQAVHRVLFNIGKDCVMCSAPG